MVLLNLFTLTSSSSSYLIDVIADVDRRRNRHHANPVNAVVSLNCVVARQSVVDCRCRIEARCERRIGYDDNQPPSVEIHHRHEGLAEAWPRPGDADHRVVQRHVIEGRVPTAFRKEGCVPVGCQEPDRCTHYMSREIRKTQSSQRLVRQLTTVKYATWKFYCNEM